MGQKEYYEKVKDAAMQNELLCVKGRLDGQGGARGIYVLSTGKLCVLRVEDVLEERENIEKNAELLEEV